MSVSSIPSSRSMKDVNRRPLLPGRVGNKHLSVSLTEGDRTVQIILRDLDKCKKVRRDRYRLVPKCEDLINYIVLQVRKKPSDHLLQATIVWALINILRFEPTTMRDVMIDAGVPALLHDILSGEQLRGATRTYASELCFYVCSTEPYEKKEIMNRIKAAMDGNASMTSSIETGSMGQFMPSQGAVLHLQSKGHGEDKSDSLSFDAEGNRLRRDDIGGVDDESLLSSVAGNESVSDFVPYRIDKDNLDHLNSLFEPKKAPGGQQLHDDVADLSYLFKNGESLQGTGDDMSIASESSWSTQTPQSQQPSQHHGLGRYRSHEESFGAGVFSGTQSIGRMDSTSTASGTRVYEPYHDMQSLGMMSVSSGIPQVAGINSRETPSLAAASGLMQGSRSMHSTGKRSPSKSKHRGFSKNFQQSLEFRSIASNLYEEKPPDIPLDLLRLDPLTMNVNRSIQAIFTDEDSLDSNSVTTASVAMSQDLNGGRHASSMVRFADAVDDEGGGLPDVMDSQLKEKWRAERLVDNAFLRALFSEHVKLGDSQQLLRSLSDVLELMDREQTGLVEWKVFSKVLLSIAPPHVLRADVTTFLDAQVDNPEDLIDYREFTISGKALIIAVEEKRGNPPVAGWLNRQRKIANDPTTYTWKNHIRWYRARMSASVVWLMRRAQRSIAQDAMLQESVRYLFHKGNQARASAFLVEAGFIALQKRASKKACYQKLMLRALHAKRTAIRREDHTRWLLAAGSSAIHRKQKLDIDDQTGDVTVTLEDEPPRDPQASYNMLYYLYREHTVAFAWLKEVAKKSMAHTALQSIAYENLSKYALQVARQEAEHSEASLWLKNTAEKAYNYGMVTDTANLSLMRTGKLAYQYLCRQLDGLDWLKARAQRAIEFSAMKDETSSKLIEFAQTTFAYMNKRETAFDFLFERRRRCEALIQNQKDAIKYLNGIAPRAIVTTVNNSAALEWLFARAEKAKIHARKMFVAREKLKLVAGRYNWVHLRMRAAQAELRELAQVGKMTDFTENWCSLPANHKRLLGEMQRMQKGDDAEKAKRDALMASGELTEEQRWLEELHDAFMFLSKVMHVPKVEKKIKKVKKEGDGSDSEESESESESESDSESDDDLSNSEESGSRSKDSHEKKIDKKKLAMIQRARDEANTGLGRIGFRMLIKQGELVHVRKDMLDHIFYELDLNKVGVLSFTEIWHWFIIKARTIHKNFKKLKFTMPDIVPISERAKLVLIRRFAAQEAALHAD